MDRNRSRRVALAILAVLAVGLVAAAATPLFEQRQGSEDPVGEPPPSNLSDRDSGAFPDVPVDLIMIAIAVLVAVSVAAQFVADPWGTLKGVLLVAVAVGLVVGLGSLAAEYLDLSQEGSQPQEIGEIGEPNATPANTSGGFGEGTSDPLVLPTDSVALIAVIAALVGGITLLAWRSGAIQAALGLEDSTGENESDADLGALGEVAGRAAADVEGAATAAAADNAIYRAWAEMVALLDAPDPQSGTPRQFAAAAIEAGMDSEDVDVLTRTFEEVRYGDAALSEARRERATEALRRIESTHREDDASAANDADRAGGDATTGGAR